jgi:hypothetical protein
LAAVVKLQCRPAASNARNPFSGGNRRIVTPAQLFVGLPAKKITFVTANAYERVCCMFIN